MKLRFTIFALAVVAASFGSFATAQDHARYQTTKSAKVATANPVMPMIDSAKFNADMKAGLEKLDDLTEKMNTIQCDGKNNANTAFINEIPMKKGMPGMKRYPEKEKG